jgi:hypothetical protein
MEGCERTQPGAMVAEEVQWGRDWLEALGNEIWD